MTSAPRVTTSRAGIGRLLCLRFGFVLTSQGKLFATGVDPTNYFHEKDGSESTTEPE